MIDPEQLHARILEELDMTREIEDDELNRLIYRVLQEASEQEYLPLARKTALGRELFNTFRKLDLLQEFLEDDTITEIMINGTQNIFYERGGRIYRSDKRFISRDKLEDVVQQIVAGGFADRGCKASRRFPCKCGPGAYCVGWADRDDTKIFERRNYHGTADLMEFCQ